MPDGKRKVPVNWTIDQAIWDKIQEMVKEKAAQAGVKISVSAVANQLLKEKLDIKD